MMTRAGLLFALMTPGCTVGDRYLVAPETVSSIAALSPADRARTVAPAHRSKTGEEANVLTHAFALDEATPRSDGQVLVQTRLPSRRTTVGSVLVWIGTPLSIAGLCMVIWGHDALRYSGIALSATAEPVMIAGTVLWVQGAKAHPQEVPRGVADLTYLPVPGQASSAR